MPCTIHRRLARASNLCCSTAAALGKKTTDVSTFPSEGSSVRACVRASFEPVQPIYVVTAERRPVRKGCTVAQQWRHPSQYSTPHQARAPSHLTHHCVRRLCVIEQKHTDCAMKLAMRPEQFTEVCIKVLGVRLFVLEHLGSQTRRGWFTRNEHSAAVRVLLCTMADGTGIVHEREQRCHWWKPTPLWVMF